VKTILKKVYSTRKKGNKPGIFLQHLVCEAAGLEEGQPIYISVNEDKEEIVIQNQPISDDDYCIHVSGRLNRTSAARRPLVDTAGERYSFLSFEDKLEITVFRQANLSRIVVKPLEYDLTTTTTVPAPKDRRITLTSICAGCGIGTANFESTNYFTPVQEIEIETDSAEVLKHNFSSSLLFNGDLRDCHEVVKSDVCLISLPCSQHSVIGNLEQNVMDNLVLATAKIIKSSQASCLFFENVPGFYESHSWFQLKELIADDYPYMTEKQIESWEFGNISTRKRKYVLCFSESEQFEGFRWPAAPKLKRKALKHYLDGKRTDFKWKSLDKWMTSFKSREAWRDRSLTKTFVNGEAKQINCITARYRSHTASSSYVLNDEGTMWRFLTESELFRIMDIPETFSFPKHIPKTRRYEMIGLSVCGRVFKAVANCIASTFMKKLFRSGKKQNKNSTGLDNPVSINGSGQLELII
jgi:DNA (cytosine-5)-methyltransferase 1